MKTIIAKLRRKKIYVLVFLVGLFGGATIGFFLAPIKNGLNIGCNNGNVYGDAEKKEQNDFHEDLAMEMGELR